MAVPDSRRRQGSDEFRRHIEIFLLLRNSVSLDSGPGRNEKGQPRRFKGLILELPWPLFSREAIMHCCQSRAHDSINRFVGPSVRPSLLTRRTRLMAIGLIMSTSCSVIFEDECYEIASFYLEIGSL